MCVLLEVLKNVCAIIKIQITHAFIILSSIIIIASLQTMQFEGLLHLVQIILY